MKKFGGKTQEICVPKIGWEIWRNEKQAVKMPKVERGRERSQNFDLEP
jgi:hypothetical protein